jgi:OOP family OmpA-OmpF porin
MHRTIQTRRARFSAALTPAVAALLAAGLFASGAAFAQNTGATVTPVGNGTVATTALSANPGAAPGTASGAVVHGTAGTANTVTPPAATTTPGQVVVGGKVPDEATKAAVLQKLLGTQLKQISKGQLKINGTQIEMKGEVHNEAQRQQLASDMANTLNPTYTIKNGLRVSASEQGVLDQTLANRTIEFETGSATLTPQGKLILDQMAAALAKMQNRTVDIIGHTDNSGNRTSNIALSQARADAVKGYLITKSIPPQQMTTTGVGPDQPIAPNDTADGRARNRRIEFRVGQ